MNPAEDMGGAPRLYSQLLPRNLLKLAGGLIGSKVSATQLGLFLSSFLLFAVLRAAVLAEVTPSQQDDTIVFTQMASLPLWPCDGSHSVVDLRVAGVGPCILAGLRPPTVPLVYKLLNSDPNAITELQLLLSLLSWGALALFVARAVRSSHLKLIAFGVVLAFSLSTVILMWERVMRSESIAFSLMALLIACGMWLIEGWRWSKVMVMLLVALLWAFTRETNSYALIMVAGLLLLCVFLRRIHWRYLSVALAFVLIFVVSDVSATAGQRWVFPFLNVLAQRVLPDSSDTAYFAERGMPVTSALEKLSGQWASSNGWAFYSDPDLANFRRWTFDKGKQSYTSFLLSRWQTAATTPLSDMGELIYPDVRFYRPVGRLFIPDHLS
ncbi:MAG: hypothetical protein IVW55_05830 [Chloroflexi bacterium]|nr:hypothetical protein [Chloroflexota bacterium]